VRERYGRLLKQQEKDIDLNFTMLSILSDSSGFLSEGRSSVDRNLPGIFH